MIVDKTHLIKQIDSLKLWHTQAIERQLELEEQLNQANSTIRDMEKAYRKLQEQYVIKCQAYDAVLRAI